MRARRLSGGARIRMEGRIGDSPWAPRDAALWQAKAEHQEEITRGRTMMDAWSHLRHEKTRRRIMNTAVAPCPVVCAQRFDQTQGRGEIIGGWKDARAARGGERLVECTYMGRRSEGGASAMRRTHRWTYYTDDSSRGALSLLCRVACLRIECTVCQYAREKIRAGGDV